MSKKILLTGITGFIGSSLAPKLLELEYEVHATIRHRAAEDSKTKIKKIENIFYHYSNLIDPLSVNDVVTSVNPEYIIHLGAISPVRYSFSNPIEYQKIDYLGTLYLIHSALKLKNFKNFLFASTMETYGWQKMRIPFKENMKLNPASPYAVAKVASEKYLHMANSAYDLPFIALKPCNTYGRKGNTDFITEYLIYNMLQQKDVFVGSPNAVRDLMYVTDHISAYIHCLRDDFPSGTYNFGWGSNLTMLDLAKIIKDKVNFEGEIKLNFPENYPNRPIVEEYLSLDNSKAKKVLGWTPKISLDEGLKYTIEYWRSQIN